MKTKRYWISFDNVEVSISSNIEISAKQYWDEMKKWDEIIEKTKDEENAGQAYKHSVKPVEKEDSIIYTDYLTFGCATVWLIRKECKPGYCFKTGGK